MVMRVAIGALLGLFSGIVVADPPSQQQIDEVQKSWDTVESKLSHEEVGVILYQNIFSISPESLKLFPFDGFFPLPDLYDTPQLKKQGRDVVDAVAFAVKGLNELDTVVPVLQSLGTRHAGRGIVQTHYDVVGQALIATLEAGLGDAWTDELSLAWTSVYGLVSDTMFSAQQAAEPDGNHGYFCSVCNHQYYAPSDGDGADFDSLPDDWVCPVCGITKSLYVQRFEMLSTDVSLV